MEEELAQLRNSNFEVFKLWGINHFSKKITQFQLKQANQDLNSDLLVQNKKRENAEKELIKFEERYKSDQKLNNDQMAKILKEMQDLEAKNKETVEKMKTKNITDSKSYQVLKLTWP